MTDADLPGEVDVPALEVLPETADADDWFGPFLYDDEDLLDRLRRLGGEVQDLVPECVGMSLSLRDQEATFTMVARGAVTRVLDAVQYADDGPCVAAVAAGEPISCPDVATETRWHTFAQATAATGVASTLSMPIMRSGRAIGGFNLYASTPHAFDRHHDGLAVLLDAWPGGATTNADLGFTTRDVARLAPRLLRESTRLLVAAGVLARLVDCSIDAAAERLRRAAAQAVVPLPALVDSIIDLLGDVDPPSD